jgi:hypothetical protein
MPHARTTPAGRRCTPRAAQHLALAVATLAFVVVPAAAAAFQCSPSPLSNCHQTTRPRKSRLNLRSNTVRPDKQTLVWKLYRGQETPAAAYGNPTTTDSYALCMYTESGGNIYQAIAPAGASCVTQPCWRTIGTRGFAFRDGQGRFNGLTKIRLYEGTEGRVRVIVKGRGAELDLAQLPMDLPTRVQLQGSHGQCWGTTFDSNGVRRNNDTRFGGRAPSD